MTSVKVMGFVHSNLTLLIHIVHCTKRSKQNRVQHWAHLGLFRGLPRWLSSKESACQCRNHKRRGFDPCVGRSPEGGHGNPFQYSCLENLMDRRAWPATVHRDDKESDMTEHAHMCLSYQIYPRFIPYPRKSAKLLVKICKRSL